MMILIKKQFVIRLSAVFFFVGYHHIFQCFYSMFGCCFDNGKDKDAIYPGAQNNANQTIQVVIDSKIYEMFLSEMQICTQFFSNVN